ncbi:PfkB family carbohydrate kinase [Shigella sonnei]
MWLVFTSSIELCGLNPGKNQNLPGGAEGISLIIWRYLGKNAWLLSAVGGDFYGQSLLAQTNQSGVHANKRLIVPVRKYIQRFITAR